MILYLLRHGEAEARAASDASRKLTLRGEQEVSSVARQFLSGGLPLQRCISSPYLRAVQTATVFLEQVDPGLGFEQSELLAPEVRASEVMQLLDTVREDHVLLVSHNPLLSELFALLTEGDISQMHILATSELVAVDISIIGLGMGSAVMGLVPDLQQKPD